MTDSLRQVAELTALRAQRARLRAEALEHELTALRRQGRVVPFTLAAARTLLGHQDRAVREATRASWSTPPPHHHPEGTIMTATAPAPSALEQLDTALARRDELRDQLAGRRAEADQADASAAQQIAEGRLDVDTAADTTTRARQALDHLAAAVRHAEAACTTAARAVLAERAQEVVQEARGLRTALETHSARTEALSAELRDHEGAHAVQLQPRALGVGIRRGLRSELMRQEVEAATRRAVALAAVAEGVPLGGGSLGTYTRGDAGAAANLLSGPDALVRVKTAEGQVPALYAVETRVRAAIEAQGPPETAA